MTNLINYSAKQKHLFKSYYCAGCKQRKPCQLLTGWDSEWKSYCCVCYYQTEQQKAQEYRDYQQVYQSKLRERQEYIQQLQLLKNYLGCQQCGSQEVDTYELYENSKLVCQPCLLKKEGGSSSPISFLEQGKWYRKFWKVEIVEWLEKYDCLPVNKNCADEWRADKQHLKNCDCLEKEARESYLLFTNSLKKNKEKLAKECQCQVNPKVRVGGDDITWCESCQEIIPVASKKRVIKNRNDPKFWGLEAKEKVLCRDCLANLVEKMPLRKKYLFNEYQKRGYWQ